MIKLYEILLMADEPLPYTALFLKALQCYTTGKPFLKWLVHRGLLEELDPSTVYMGAYMAGQRRRKRSVKAVYSITEQGKMVRKQYEALFNTLGLLDRVRERFPHIPRVTVKA